MTEIALFVLAFVLRLTARRGVPQDFDSHGHLYFAKELKAQQQGPFGSITTKVIDGIGFSAPFLWHWIVGFFSIPFISKHQRYWNPLIDSLFAVAIYSLTLHLGFSVDAAFLSIALYVLTPMWFSRLAVGPRIQSFSPRLSGELATNLFFVVVCLPLDLPAGLTLVIGVVLAGYVLASSKFGVQALLFLTPLISIFLASWLPLVALFLAVLMVAAVSKGMFLNSLKQQLSHLRWYFLKNLKGGMAVSNRNRFDELYRRRVGEGFSHYLARVLIMLIGRNAYTGLVLKLPALWVSLTILVFWPNGDIAAFYWAPVAAACILFVLINIPQLLFLGEAERYLNHVALFIVLFAVQAAVQSDLLWVYWVIAFYGFLYLVCEAMLLPMLNKQTVENDADAAKVIEFLASQKPTTVLSYPYHAGGGVYRIMSETPHRTVFPFGTTDTFVKKLEKTYAAEYPYVDLSKLDDMRADFDVGILVARKKSISERLSADWSPSSEWRELDLGLKSQRVFIYQNV